MAWPSTVVVLGLFGLFALFTFSRVANMLGRANQRAEKLTRPPLRPKVPATSHPEAARTEARARQVFDGVYTAWNSQNAEALRQWTSDGVYSRFATLLDLQARAGFRNETEVTGVPEVTVTSIAPGGRWDRAEVHYTVTAIDRDRAPDGDLRREEPMSFEEIWTFLRIHRDAPTGPPAAAGTCPACGAPLPDGATPRCASCGAISNSGEHDWVLAEITQPGAPQRRPFALPAALAAAFPELSVAVLEDRASAAFWAWIAAGLRGKPELLSAFSAPGARLAPAAYSQVGVGAVDTVALEQTATGLTASVEVDWSGASGGLSANHRSRLVFETVGPPREGTLATLSCGDCGGPLDRSDDPSCRWCSAPRVPGPGTWQLVSLTLG